MFFSPVFLWFIAGVIFVLAEFVIPGFVICFFGVSALIVAGLIWLVPSLSITLQLLLFAALGVAFFVGRPDIGRLLVALGGLLFVVSDNILFAYKFHDNTRFDRNIALHIAYYLAQLLIACSIALI